MELYYVFGFGIVCEVKGWGLIVFLDLKFYDIFNIVEWMMWVFGVLGVNFVIIYVVGGIEMMKVVKCGFLVGVVVVGWC